MKWKRSALRGSKGRKMPDVLICSGPSCLVRIWVSWVVPATQVSIVVLLCDLDHVEAIVFYAVSNWRHYRLGDACWCWSTPRKKTRVHFYLWKSSQGMIQLCSWFGDLLRWLETPKLWAVRRPSSPRRSTTRLERHRCLGPFVDRWRTPLQRESFGFAFKFFHVFL